MKKAQATGKIVREMMVAAKMGGADPESNARLAAAVEKARKESVSREVIERALERLKKSQIGAPRQIARIVPAAAELPRLVLARRAHDHA